MKNCAKKTPVLLSSSLDSRWRRVGARPRRAGSQPRRQACPHRACARPHLLTPPAERARGLTAGRISRPWRLREAPPQPDKARADAWPPQARPRPNWAPAGGARTSSGARRQSSGRHGHGGARDGLGARTGRPEGHTRRARGATRRGWRSSCRSEWEREAPADERGARRGHGVGGGARAMGERRGEIERTVFFV